YYIFTRLLWTAKLLLSCLNKTFCNFSANGTISARSIVSTEINAKFLCDFHFHLIQSLLSARHYQLIRVVGIVICHDVSPPLVHIDCVRKRRSEEHTSELQSRFDLVCRLLL